MHRHLSISYERVSKNVDSENIPIRRRIPQYIQNVRFIIVDKGKSSYEVLDCLSEDLIDFCNKIYLSGFLCNCFGVRSTSILEYKWRQNSLIVHGKNESRITLTMENVEDIKKIANPSHNNDCLLY